jgi:hypothetical protein
LEYPPQINVSKVLAVTGFRFKRNLVTPSSLTPASSTSSVNPREGRKSDFGARVEYNGAAKKSPETL